RPRPGAACRLHRQPGRRRCARRARARARDDTRRIWRSGMICIEISKPGEPDVLVPVERPTPTPAANEVLIKVAAAGVNRPDVMQRRGKYPPPPGASDIPGLEVAGTIDAVGPGVRDWKRGDRVCALLAGGGYADHCVAPAPQCLPVPSGLEMTTAAAIPETF